MHMPAAQTDKIEPNRIRRCAKTVLAASLLLFLGGCSTKAIAAQDLHGRWLSVKEEDFLEFTPMGLCAEVSTVPEKVVAGRYELNGNTVNVTLLTSEELYLKPKSVQPSPPTESWTVRLDGPTLTVVKPRGSQRYHLAPPAQGSSALVGLWSSRHPDGRTDYCEFTP